MRVLGIFMGHDSGAAVVEDGRILAAVNEECLCRMKLVSGFPRGAIREVFRLAGMDATQLDAVLVGGVRGSFRNELQPFGGNLEGGTKRQGWWLRRASGPLARYRNKIPGLEAAYYALLTPYQWKRRWLTPRVLREEFGVRCPVRYVDHHFAHIASAYFTSGMRDALAVSLDGGGDRKSSLVYAVRNGKFEHLHTTAAYDSLGNWYAYVTKLCGFQAHKHEGKITGLAAHGEPKYVPILERLIDEEKGRIINRGEVVRREALRELDRRLPKGWTREDLAASIQQHCEDVARRYVGYWARRSGLRNLVLAGGVVANVRVNEELHSLPEIDRIFIYPHMGDGGLAGGAALAACVPGVLPQTMRSDPEPLRDVYLGSDLGERKIAAALRAHGLSPEPVDGPLEETIADLLAQGYVVARADGRMEYGPRALGNRSILYQPTNPRVNDWLNQNLRRTEFMPFAPSVLYEARKQCFERVAGAEHAAEFMTVTFHCTPWMREHLPGVVHLDGTARPQLVRKDRNPNYYRIIDAFRRRTGLPAVINTSFNMHEEPIVCTADDCVRAFLDGNLDYLALGPHLIRHPRGITHPLTPARCVRSGAFAM